jgi:hypothetical protein
MQNRLSPRRVQILMRVGFALACLCTITALGATEAPALAPTELPGLRWTNAFFPGTTYLDAVPRPDELLGFPLAQRATSALEIERCLKAWAGAAADRARLVEYARTYENRPLYYLIITSPRNLARLDEIQAGYAKLGDPRRLAESEAHSLIETLPPVAWLAYTIHGDETEGSDAALAMIYHLLAAKDPPVAQMLDDMIVIVDPLMNPDGRDRFVKMITENRGTTPNVDDRSLVHDGYWPFGRGNHYLFDLNRDWLAGVHPESRGRIREVGRWCPVLFVDGHGMGAQETRLFSPPREPVNPNMPQGRMAWEKIFARAQADALDRQPLSYYTGEWNEEWYPGYSDAWASYRGVVGILYEQARVAEDGVRRPEGRILSYRESVLHHVIGSMADLRTLHKNRQAIVAQFCETRRLAVAPQGPYAERTFAILPTANQSRRRALIDLLRSQGFEAFETIRECRVSHATNQLGRECPNLTLPAGTLLIPNRQPLAHLLAAMFEFDPRLSAKALEKERNDLLGKGESGIYDTTSWNITMMFDLEAVTLAGLPTVGMKSLPELPNAAGGITGPAERPIAYVFDGDDDHSVAVAARLMERGIQVRVADKPFAFDRHSFARGSVLVMALDNRDRANDLRRQVEQTSIELALPATAIASGWGDGDLPDIGGRHFLRLEPPRLALLGRGGFSSGDYGATWFVLDHHLAIRHSNVEEGSRTDWSRYNVIVIPERGGAPLPEGLMASLKDWVRNGGTLIAVGSGALPFINEKAEFSKVRTLPDVLGKLDEYELSVWREWMGRTSTAPPADQLWSHQASTDLKYPWQFVEGARPDEKELKKRDAWQRLFMPQGAFIASRVNTNHWLTFGGNDCFPALVGRQAVLMAAEGIDVPIRYGLFVPSSLRDGLTNTTAASSVPEDGRADNARKSVADKKKEPARIGWVANPPGYDLELRMSGLLWPEAAHRIAHGAYLTRESLGRGQIIIFATPPNFRASTRGAMRLFLNAVVYGPGCGAAQPIRP